jgi:hypothetical protein
MIKLEKETKTFTLAQAVKTNSLGKGVMTRSQKARSTGEKTL